jgi:transmembrane sensor|tara:strand:+ start:13969 stop:14883 length:915 start_codon:yes stop_codon:yes gene_type:complete
MEENKDLLNWLNREISEEELMHIKKNENFKTLERIAHYSSQIAVPKIDVAEALQDLNRKKKQTVKKGKIRFFNTQQLYRYAAAIVVLFASTYYLTLNPESHFKTEFSQIKTFKLPDSSVVTLNANSEISYTKKGWEGPRDIFLKGEAYFRVQKGGKFTVHTALGEVSVLGTQFNIKERKDFFEVKTYEGLVSVQYKDLFIKLPQGAVFRVVNGTIDRNTTFDVGKKSWRQRESSFKSTPLRFVLEEIENQFGCTVETQDVNLNTLYSGGFSHGDLNIALKSITIPLQLTYRIIGNKITLYNYDR